MSQSVIDEDLPNCATDGEEENVLANGGVSADKCESGSKFIARAVGNVEEG